MVQKVWDSSLGDNGLSVLALSSRFDGRQEKGLLISGRHLSVLALSSRFDGRLGSWFQCRASLLSVLALSSRFDGRFTDCRNIFSALSFQYSLCRVVLMVFVVIRRSKDGTALSVLALSSRFDGQ